MDRNTDEKIVFFVIWGLRPGGAERVFVNIVNNISHPIKPVVIILGEKEGFAEELNCDLEVHFLNKRSRWDVFRLIRQLASLMSSKKPATILSFGYYANQLVVLARRFSSTSTPICINERTETSSSLRRMNFQFVRRLLLKLLYRKAEKVIVVSNMTRDTLINEFALNKEKISVIYNPIDLKRIRLLAHEEPELSLFKDENAFVIIACGRLIESKGFSLLIRAFAAASMKLDNLRLAILGEGEERRNLEALITELRLEEKVHLLGYQKNPFKFMARSQVFVLSSFYEGFPNVVLEAFACGSAVIATRCASGPEEIISDKVNGLLIPVGDKDSLTKAILQLADEEDLRKELIKGGLRRVEDFPLETIVKLYEDTLNGLINE